MRALPLTALAAFTALTGCQLLSQTFIVDKQSGPGTAFTSISAAVAAVPSGAVLLVRPGDYLSFSIDNKSISVIAPDGATIDDLGAYIPIANLSANQHVVLHGLDMVGLFGSAAIECTDNLGSILIDSCSSSQLTSSRGGRLVVANSRDVQVRNCLFWPLSDSPVRCFQSHLTVSQSVLLNGMLGAGVQITDSTSQFANVWIGGSAFWALSAPLYLTNSDVRILGDSTLSVQWSMLPFGPGPVIEGQSSVFIDPKVSLESLGAVPFGTLIQATTQAMPVVAAEPAAVGGTAQASLQGSGVGMLLLGLPGLPLTIPGITAPILLQPGTETLLAAGPLLSALTASYVVPSQPQLLGVRVTWQGASLDAAFGLQISNAISYVHY